MIRADSGIVVYFVILSSILFLIPDVLFIAFALLRLAQLRAHPSLLARRLSHRLVAKICASVVSIASSAALLGLVVSELGGSVPALLTGALALSLGSAVCLCQLNFLRIEMILNAHTPSASHHLDTSDSVVLC